MWVAICVFLILWATQSELRVPLDRIKRSTNPTLPELLSRRSLLQQTDHQNPKSEEGTGTPKLVSLRDISDIMYTGSVSIGTPPQHFTMLFDTGSADLWVISNQASNTEPKAYLNYYQSGQSSTYHANGTKWSIKYGLGTCAGFLSYDDVTVGGLTANKQLFAEANELSKNFENPREPLDGIVGLGFKSGSTTKTPTFLDTLHSHGLITHRMFAFSLESDHEKGSELILGSPAASNYQGQLLWLPVLHNVETSHRPVAWLVDLDGLVLRSHSSDLKLCGEEWGQHQCVALPDSGTSFLALPEPLFSQFTATLQKARPDCFVDQHKNILCNDKSVLGMPTLTFTFQDVIFELDGRDYLLSNGQVGVQILALPASATPAQITFVILGDIFLRKVFAVFDADKPAVGLAYAAAALAPGREASPGYAPEMAHSLALLLLTVCAAISYWCYFRETSDRYEPIPDRAL
jgi:hypothetical protein